MPYVLKSISAFRISSSHGSCLRLTQRITIHYPACSRSAALNFAAMLSLLFCIVSTPYIGKGATIGSPITAGGYTFVNFDPPLAGNAVGSNANGISNAGQVVGTQVDANNASTFSNYAGLPASTTALNTGNGQIAFGINSSGNVVGGNGDTGFYLPQGGTVQTLMNLTFAFGINDKGNIVGQTMSPLGTAPGLFLPSATGGSSITINAPSGPNTVNAQGINNNGQIVGFYLGTDGQVHGFQANLASAVNNVLTGTPVADPTIPNVPEEPGATFVFSQILGVNDSGLAVGYYGDSTTSQHGYFYNTNTGLYTFLDDPAAQFSNDVKVTQITGISNAGEIAGFYTDGQGLAHSFIATPVPEPGSFVLAALAMASIAFGRLRSRSKPV